MRNIKNRLLLNAILCCLSCLLAQSCIEDIFPDNTTKDFEITLNIQNDLEVITRATPDLLGLKIERGFILVYNNSNNVKTFRSIYPIDKNRIVNNGSSNPRITMEGIILKDDVVVLILNPTDQIVKNPPTSVEYSAINTIFELGTTGFENAINSLPMSGEYVHGSVGPVQITRSVAKIEVIIDLDLNTPGGNSAGFTPGNVKYEIFQQVTKGHITKPITGLNYVSTNNGSPIREIGTDYLFNKTLDLNGVSYIYEYPYSNKSIGGGSLTNNTYDKNRLAVILKVTRGDTDEYYRLDLYDQTTNTFLDIKRNTHYKIFIKSINRAGYASASEALISQSSNTIINYVILIGDENKVTDGKMTIIAKPDFDILILRDPSYTEFHGVEVKYILSPGTDIPTNTISYGPLPAGISGNLNPSSLTADFQSIGFTINANAPASFEYQITYAVTLGDLVYRDTLQISRKPTLDCHKTTINVGDSAMVFSNTIPLGWRRMLNPANEAEGYVSCDQTHANAIPVIEDLKINEYHTTSLGKRIKYMIAIKAPRYIGRYSENPDNIQKHLIMETIEETSGLAWQAALAYCKRKSVSDEKPWRLPKRKEFQGIYKSSNPYQELFGGTFWLDSFFSLLLYDYSHVAYCNDKGKWNFDLFGKRVHNSLRVRCVRDI